ncbi:MAG: acyltransferase family protein, partial [Acutalibacteraceae bacterium]
LFRRIFLCGSGVYWYLLAMFESACIIFLIDKYHLKKLLKVLIVIGILLGIAYDSFNGLLSYTPYRIINNLFYQIFSWSNNFIMKGIPYMGIGYLLVTYKTKLKTPFYVTVFVLSTALNILLFFAYDITHISFFEQNSLCNQFFFLQAISFFIISKNVKINISQKASLICRELSSSIYFLHSLIIYYVIDIIFGIDLNFFLKMLFAIVLSVAVYCIVKVTKIKLLEFALNIKSK